MRLDIRQRLRVGAEYIADIFAPNRCPCCDGFIRWDEVICEGCKCRLSRPDGDIGELPEGCSRAVAAFYYRGAAKRGIYALKDGYGRNFARYAASVLAERLDREDFDLITCVPTRLGRSSMQLRGHAETFALELSRRTGIPCETGLLKRTVTRNKLHLLSASDRGELAKTMYALCDAELRLDGRRLIVADDVLTTGATLSACASLLKGCGAQSVTAVTICRTLLGEAADDEDDT